MPSVLHRQAEARRYRRSCGALREALRQTPEGTLTPLRDRELTPEEERRRALLEAKLGALVREHFGETSAQPAAFGIGAAAIAGRTGWVLAAEHPARSLGAALAWARAKALDELHVLADQDTGVLARRTAAFASGPRVWRIEGRALAEAEPEPFPPDPVIDPGVTQFADQLSSAGADLVVEHGVLLGEVLGLEVARVVTEHGGPRLEIGVGRFDREATVELYGDQPETETLAAVIEVVRKHRSPGAEPHPLNRLAPERWLRSMLLADPGLVGADHLAPMAPPLPRPSLKASSPAPTVGVDPAGDPVVAVCSTGIDLDLVPSAADARIAAFGAEPARLVLVLPERDDHPVTRALAAMLEAPAEIVTVPADWRARVPR